jgi:hypothetical protein
MDQDEKQEQTEGKRKGRSAERKEKDRNMQRTKGNN